MPQAVICDWCGTWVPLALQPIVHNVLETTDAGTDSICTEASPGLRMKRYSFKSTLTADLSGTRWEAISGLKSEVSKVSMLSDGSIKRCIPNYMQQCEDKMISIDKARVSFPTQTQLKRYKFRRSLSQSICEDPPAQSEPGRVPSDCPQQ